MQYPLQEEIGSPDLFVGRERELQNFRKWIGGDSETDFQIQNDSGPAEKRQNRVRATPL